MTKFLSFVLLILISINISCREEEYAFEGDAPGESLRAGSNVASLVVRTTLNDGSKDNIIDQASCVSLQLPVTVVVNGSEIIVNIEDDFDVIEDIFEENNDDTDTLNIIFPISIILSDFSEVMVLNATELSEYTNVCPDENQQDEDIECIDFLYPITVKSFNTNTEEVKTLNIPNDKALFNFLTALKNTEVVNFQFPIYLVFPDGMEMEATDLEKLENYIENANGTCDEDDDNDFNDDDCNDCSIDKLNVVLETCTEWVVDELILNDTNFEDLYTDLSFSFQEDDILMVTSTTETLFGTWTASGSGNLINVEILVSGLDDFNGSWLLNKIGDNNSQAWVNLRMGDNILRFDNACISGNGNGNVPHDVIQVLSDGNWSIDSFIEGDIDRTDDFNGYTLTFDSNGNVIADNGSVINGTWVKGNSAPTMEFNFDATLPFDLINDNWSIFSVMDASVEFIFEDSQDQGRTDILVLNKQ